MIPVLAEQFRDVFPELYLQVDFVTKVVHEEEEAFLRTLDKGLKKMDEIVGSLGGSASKTGSGMATPDAGPGTSASKMIHGAAAFELYDTFGFPIDLTGLIARENNLDVDQKGFDAAMKQQKDRSRAATTLDTEDWVVLVDNPLIEFVGYEMLETNTRLSKYRKVKSKGKESWQLVLEATPFYAESGGQVGDTGILVSKADTIRVFDTKKENDLIIQFTDELPSDLQTGIIARVNRDRRKGAEVHHSATHLLHAALRKVLGTHVAQKGSLVNEEQLRFDFSHFAKMTDEEIAGVEQLVNEKIRENIPVIIKEMQKEEALKIGAMALFGEKYGDKVRVVIIDPSFSVELCGGTHVGSTGELGFFAIRHESAVAAGVRRIEAVAGRAAEEYINQQFGQLHTIREALKHPKEIQRAVENMVTENGELKKQLEKAGARQLSELRQQLLQKIQPLGGVQFIGEVVEASSADALKKLCFDLKSSLSALPGTPPFLVVLAANVEGKAAVAVLVDDKSAESNKALQAPAIIKEQIAPLIKGGGGGQKTLATAGGQDAGNLPQVIERVRSLLIK